MIYHTYSKIKGLNQGGIKIYIDNFKNHKEIIGLQVKATEGATDGAASISEIKRLLKEMTINIIIEHRWINKKKIQKFEDDPLTFLLQECDTKSKIIREQVK